MELISETLKTVRTDIESQESKIPNSESKCEESGRLDTLRNRFRLNIVSDQTINVSELATTVAELTLEPEGRWRYEFMSNGFNYIRAMILAVEILFEQIAIRDFAIRNRGAYLRGLVKKILSERNFLVDTAS